MLAYDWTYDSSTDRPMEQRFHITYRALSRTPMSWRDEVLAAAKRIADTETRPLLVCLSGGIDSEVLARAFMELGVPFTALTVEFTDGTNAHDIAYADKFCQRHGIKQEIMKLDPAYHFAQGIDRWVKAGYEAYSFYRYMQLYLVERAERMGCVSIHGGGTDCQTYFTHDDEICFKQNPGLICVLQWMQRKNSRHYPYFFTSTPEMCAAYQQIDVIETLLRNPDYFRSATKSSVSLEKQIVMHALWPGMETRDKYTGFEFLQQQADVKAAEMARLFPHLGKKYFPIRLVRQQLGLKPL